MTRRQRKAMQGRNCPYCRRPMTIGKRMPTRDHIYPAEWGGRNVSENIKIVCSDCNGLRGTVNHCIGALACARSVALDIGIEPLFVILRWRLHRAK